IGGGPGVVGRMSRASYSADEYYARHHQSRDTFTHFMQLLITVGRNVRHLYQPPPVESNRETSFITSFIFLQTLQHSLFQFLYIKVAIEEIVGAEHHWYNQDDQRSACRGS